MRGKEREASFLKREEGLAAMLTIQAKLYEGTLLSHLARAKTALNLPEW